MSASTDEPQRVLERLEAERHGRALGIVGPAAAVAGDWLAWISSEIRAAMTSRASKVKAENASPACTTTYSRTDEMPKNDEQPSHLSEPEPTAWHRLDWHDRWRCLAVLWD